MTTLTTLELTPNAIALLLAGTDRENIEKTIFHCGSCNLYYCWADLEYHQFDRECGSDLCPRWGPQDLAMGDESFPSPNRFTFLWKNGSRRVLTGSSPDEALSNAGYSAYSYPRVLRPRRRRLLAMARWFWTFKAIAPLNLT